jgi:hypothetical protein
LGRDLPAGYPSAAQNLPAGEAAAIRYNRVINPDQSGKSQHSRWSVPAEQLVAKRAFVAARLLHQQQRRGGRFAWMRRQVKHAGGNGRVMTANLSILRADPNNSEVPDGGKP